MPTPVTSELARSLAATLEQDFAGVDFRDAVHWWDSLVDVRRSLPTMTDASARDDLHAAFGYLSLAVLPILSDQEALETLNTMLLVALDRHDYNVQDVVRRKLLGLEIIEDRDELRRKMRDMLLANTLPLTSASPGTVGAWLHEYIALNGDRDDLKYAAFLGKAKGSAQYSSTEIDRLERLLQLFDYLRLSSAAEGFEEEVMLDLDGKMVTMEQGAVTVTDPALDPFITKVVPQIFEDADRARALTAIRTPVRYEQDAEALLAAQPMESNAAVSLLGQWMGGKGTPADAVHAVAALIRVLSSQPVVEVLRVTGARSVRELFEAVLGERGANISAPDIAALAARIIAKTSTEDRMLFGMDAYYDMQAHTFVWGEEHIVPIV